MDIQLFLSNPDVLHSIDHEPKHLWLHAIMRSLAGVHSKLLLQYVNVFRYRSTERTERLPWGACPYYGSHLLTWIYSTL